MNSDQNQAINPAWGGRFAGASDSIAQRFTASISFDQRLAEVDIRGSIAHAEMLGHCGIIPEEDSQRLVEGLSQLLEDVRRGAVDWDVAAEDIHMNVERKLFERIGDVAGKLHTARSRNDQVATDTRLWLREQIDGLVEAICQLQGALVGQAESHAEAIMPGYTHTQRAQPVRLAHHLLAYFWMLERDRERLIEARRRVNVMPLGAGALAGTPHPIDREFTARRLGFERIAENSMDAVSDRDFAIEATADLALLMMHLSRLAGELVLWQSREFSFVMMDDSMTTGSSIMPQKKNPDVAELIRGKTGRVNGDLVALLTIMKGLPLTYNSDMQEDKERLFDAVDTSRSSLVVMERIIATVDFRVERMEEALAGDYSTATDLADALAKRGMPFREAHGIVGRLVRRAEELGKTLETLTAGDLSGLALSLDEEILKCLQPRASVEARQSQGGTASGPVHEQLQRAPGVLGPVMARISWVIAVGFAVALVGASILVGLTGGGSSLWLFAFAPAVFLLCWMGGPWMGLWSSAALFVVMLVSIFCLEPQLTREVLRRDLISFALIGMAAPLGSIRWIAPSVRRRKLLDELRWNEKLADLTQTVCFCEDMETALDLVIIGTDHIVKAPGRAVLLYNPATGELQAMALSGLPPTFLTGPALSLPRSELGRCLADGACLVSFDVRRSGAGPPFAKDPTARAYVLAPLVSMGGLIGALYLRWPEPRDLSNASIQRVREYADSIAFALERIQTSSRFQQMALTDELTGLYNRRTLQIRLKEEMARVDREGIPLTMMMLDLNDFKAINDKFGHPVGDQVLRSVGQAIRAQCRASDVPVRCGGDEFALICPSMTMQDGWEAAERLRLHIERMAIAVTGRDEHVSIGLASYPETASNAQQLIEQADAALYQAKVKSGVHISRSNRAA